MLFNKSNSNKILQEMICKDFAKHFNDCVSFLYYKDTN